MTVRFEHVGSGFGIGTPTPRLSWRIPAGLPGPVSEAEVALRSGDDVVSARVEGPDQVLVAWPFAPLRSRQRGEVRVRVRAGGEWAQWGEWSPVEATLLDAGDWSARFVSPRDGGATAPELVGTVTIPADVAAARLHVTALGLHVTSINGQRVGDEELAPGWTSYDHRVRFRTHDVTALLRPGENVVTMLLGNGWYRGRLGWFGARNHYGERLAGLAQLEVTTADGTVTTWGTDATWTARATGVLADDLYDGQTTDLRVQPGEPAPVEVLDVDLSRLVPPEGPPVRVVATVPARSVTRSPSGAQLVDFGENLVGRLRLRVRGAPGQRITLRHAEVLEHGELGVRPLRTAEATDVFVLAGTGAEVCEPLLTFHGFRYAQIDGVEVEAADVEAVVLASDLRPTGSFGCSEPDVETLHANVVRSMRGNMLDIPTDCPQRDERLGWTGDIQVFGPTACFIADAAGFLTSWLRDMAAEQQPDGSVPWVVPDVLHTVSPSAAAWGDAATVVPWTLYERFGDAGVLARQLPSMKAWVDREAALTDADGLWSGGFQFGDWLDPAAPPDDPFAARTDPDVIATAHLARSAGIVARAAEVLGRADDARHYGELAAATRAAFARAYVTPAGRIASDSVTAYAMALVWDLLPEPDQRAGAGARLADLVRGAAFRVATGFVGTPLVCDALTVAGHPELAYRLLLERGCPSWLYPVTMGATTIWERWDSMLPDGSINPGGMTSFNHYALGAVADWLHRTVAGLAPGAPGYREIVVAPVPDRALTSARARHDTPYGPAAVAWQRAGGVFTLDVEVPPGTTATVHLPGSAAPRHVREGRHRFEAADPCAVSKPVRTIRDAVDDAAVFAAITDAVTKHGTGNSGVVVDMTRTLARHLAQPVADLPTVLALEPSAADLRAALAELVTTV